MKVIVFGATGMVGQGVLRECLLDPDVEGVLCISRTPLPQKHDKLQVALLQDFTDYTPIEAQLWGYDDRLRWLGRWSPGVRALRDVS